MGGAGTEAAGASSLERRRSVAVRTPARQAETVRRALVDAGLLDVTLEPASNAGSVDFPVRGKPSMIEAVVSSHPGAHRVEGEYVARPQRPGSYGDLLVDLPADVRAVLPTSFDVVGDVAVVKLPEPVLPHAERVADALLQTHRQLRTVALDRGVQGAFRVRDLAILRGGPSLVTIHREHGLAVEVDLARVYFSPRLATERARLSARIPEGSRVLDLFAGVGALVCLVGRTRAPAAMCAIDLNPDATRLLSANLARNGIRPGLVEVRTGDARAVAPRTRDWDHVVLNLPHDAASFLDIAAACVAPHGEVHVYAMVERAARAATGDELAARMAAATEAGWRVAEVRHVRNYAPTMDGLAYTLSAA